MLLIEDESQPGAELREPVVTVSVVDNDGARLLTFGDGLFGKLGNDEHHVQYQPREVLLDVTRVAEKGEENNGDAKHAQFVAQLRRKHKAKEGERRKRLEGSWSYMVGATKRDLERRDRSCERERALCGGKRADDTSIALACSPLAPRARVHKLSARGDSTLPQLQRGRQKKCRTRACRLRSSMRT